MTDPIDRSLANLLATPDRDPDAAFVAYIDACVRYEQYVARRRVEAFKRVAMETAAGAAVLAAFTFAARIGDPSNFISLISPATAGLVAVSIWGVVTLRGPFQPQQ